MLRLPLSVAGVAMPRWVWWLFAVVLSVALCFASEMPVARAETAGPSPSESAAAGVAAADSDGDGTPDRPDLVSASVTARVLGAAVEDLSQRSETVRVLVNPDGTSMQEAHAAPVWVRDAEGVWVEVDYTLVPREGGYAPKASPSSVVIWTVQTDHYHTLCQMEAPSAMKSPLSRPRARRIVIVGAGLAGLALARRFKGFGLESVVVEAEASIGGVCRSREIEGFICDHGLHVVSGYALAEVLDPRVFMPLLRPLPMTRLIEPDGTETVLEESMSELPLLVAPDQPWGSELGEEQSDERLAFAALSRDISGTSTYNGTSELAQDWMGVAPSLLSSGIGGLPALLAVDADVRLGVKVLDSSYRRDEWVLETTRETMAADIVIVTAARNPSADARFREDAPLWSTFWFEAPAEMNSHAGVHLLAVAANHPLQCCVVTGSAPELAPSGRALVSVTTPVVATAAEVLPLVQRLWGVQVGGWELLCRQQLAAAPRVGSLDGGSSRRVGTGYWELFAVNGHTETIHRAEALADRIAAKIAPNPFKSIRNLLREREQWEDLWESRGGDT